ncbi:hypothetical protein GW846_00905 [Candidatus Gracilibacteria bacterium]|nr:hypothetical protein [Candidatus Gracilibacteria bacterium]
MKNKILSAVLVLGIASTSFAAVTNANNSSTHSLLFGSKSEIRQLMDKVEAGESLTSAEQAKLDELESHKAEIVALGEIKIKLDAGETLSTEEQTLLDIAEANGALMHGKMRGHEGFGKRGGFKHLTDDDKIALASMNEAEKQDFFSEKKEQFKAQKNAHKIVIDKLITGEALTASEETTRLELIARFEDENNKHPIRKGQGDLILKLIAGDELTATEQIRLTEIQAKNLERQSKNTSK